MVSHHCGGGEGGPCAMCHRGWCKDCLIVIGQAEVIGGVGVSRFAVSDLFKSFLDRARVIVSQSTFSSSHRLAKPILSLCKPVCVPTPEHLFFLPH